MRILKPRIATGLHAKGQNMKINKVGLSEGKKLDVRYPIGVDITIMMDGDTGGTKYLTENITRIKPGLTLSPPHSHKDIEEITYVIEGTGEVWIDGKTCEIKKGDSLLWPVNSRHTVRNTGQDTLVLLCLFSTPNYRKEGAYLRHEDEVVEF